MTCFVYERCRFLEDGETAGEFEEAAPRGREVWCVDVRGAVVGSERWGTPIREVGYSDPRGRLLPPAR